jgi:hypothetical protein
MRVLCFHVVYLQLAMAVCCGPRHVGLQWAFAASSKSSIRDLNGCVLFHLVPTADDKMSLNNQINNDGSRHLHSY